MFEKWAATHGYELIKKKEPAKPGEMKQEAAAPFKMQIHPLNLRKAPKSVFNTPPAKKGYSQGGKKRPVWL